MPTESNQAHPTASTATTNGNGGGGDGNGASLAAFVDTSPNIPPPFEPFIPPPSGCCAGGHCTSPSKVPLVYSKDSVPGASTHFCDNCGGLYHCVLLCGQYVREVKGILDDAPTKNELGIKFDPNLLSLLTSQRSCCLHTCYLCHEYGRNIY